MGLSVGFALLLLAGCAPVIVTPRELVSRLSYDAAYAAVVHTIDTQPYLAGTGGWIITQAGKQSGFISARLGAQSCVTWGFGPFTYPHLAATHCRDYASIVTVTLVERKHGTAVSIGASDTYEAHQLAARIRAALRPRESLAD